MKTPEQYEAIISSLSRQLAAKQEELDDWRHTNKIDELYRLLEAANMGQKLAREELAKLNAKAAEKPDYKAIAQAANYIVEYTLQDTFYWLNMDSCNCGYQNYTTPHECWKAACEENGLLGEK